MGTEYWAVIWGQSTEQSYGDRVLSNHMGAVSSRATMCEDRALTSHVWTESLATRVLSNIKPTWYFVMIDSLTNASVCSQQICHHNHVIKKTNYVIHDILVCFCRIDTLSTQYSELEDEFRLALQIEAGRFKEVRGYSVEKRRILTWVIKFGWNLIVGVWWWKQIPGNLDSVQPSTPCTGFLLLTDFGNLLKVKHDLCL